jgi:hypothetical protein
MLSDEHLWEYLKLIKKVTGGMLTWNINHDKFRLFKIIIP